MVRRVRTAQVNIDVPAWILEYHPSPAHPTVQPWFLAVREYVVETRLADKGMSLWLHVMASAYAQRRQALDPDEKRRESTQSRHPGISRR